MNEDIDLNQEQIDQIEAKTREQAIRSLDKYKNPDGHGWIVLMWSPWILCWMRVALIWHPTPELFAAAANLAKNERVNVAVVNVWNVWDDHPIEIHEVSSWHGRD